MTGRLTQICRHPIKSHGREMLASVRLLAGEGMPFDRHWAVAHEAAKLVDGWNPCVNFSRGSKAPELMAITAQLDEVPRRVTLSHPKRDDLVFCPDDQDDVARFLAWSRGLVPPDRAQSARIVTAGRMMSDTDYPSVSILNIASNRDLAHHMGMELSLHRWRGNLWVDGWQPWQECDLVGRKLRIGDAVLEVIEPIERCRATMTDPATGEVAGDTLAALRRIHGHQNFGIYAMVVQGGEIMQDDMVEPL